MKTEIKFKIVTPDGVVYDDAIKQVSIPTTTGQITVLPNHIPLVSQVGTGELLVYKNGEPMSIAVSQGILEVRPHSEVYIMADNAERAEAIDLERANAARQRAEELLAQKQVEDIDFARIQAMIEREVNRVKVGKKYKKLPPV